MFSWRFSGAQRMQWGGGFFRVGAGALSLAKGFLARGAPRVPGLNWRFCVSSSRPPMAAAGNSGPPGATSGHFARAQFSRGFSKKRKEKGGFKVSTMGTRVSGGCHGGRGSFAAKRRETRTGEPSIPSFSGSSGVSPLYRLTLEDDGLPAEQPSLWVVCVLEVASCCCCSGERRASPQRNEGKHALGNRRFHLSVVHRGSAHMAAAGNVESVPGTGGHLETPIGSGFLCFLALFLRKCLCF